jgi:hypothetical protein
MTRVLVCGQAFTEAIDVLGLEPVADRPDLVLLDLDDAAAVARAADVPAGVPRLALAGSEREQVLRAIGSNVVIARSAEPAAIGPLIAAAAPPRARARSRLVVVTGVAGGLGRTLLTVNLAVRLAGSVSVLVLDVTGTGAAAWWLGLAPSSWADLEGLTEELTAEHLAVVASERDRIRCIGGSGAMPSVPLIAATARVSGALADVVLVDAASFFDPRTRALIETADRVLLVAGDTPTTSAAIGRVDDHERIWVIASRWRADRIDEREVLRSLPDDPASVRAALGGPSRMSGALGRAYDELAELLALDVA